MSEISETFEPNGNDGEAVDGAHSYWLITLNNYEETGEYARIEQLGADYIVGGREVAPTTGMPHMHLLLYFKKKVRFSRIKRILPTAWARWILARDWKRVRRYCIKDGDVVEIGTEPVAAGDAGRQAGATRKEAFASARKLADEGRIDEIDEELRVKYLPYYEKMAKESAMARARASALASLKSHPLRPWQRALNSILEAEPDDRTIRWVYDPTGGGGKSWFASDFVRRGVVRAQVILPASSRDISLVIDPLAKVFFFDIARTTGEHVPWKLVEELKNGLVFSPKYWGAFIHIPHPHIVILSNAKCPPCTDKEGFSKDRVRQLELDPTDWTMKRIDYS